MLKIDDPIIKDLSKVKYEELTYTSFLNNYEFENENISLLENVDINECKFINIKFNEIQIKDNSVFDVIFENCDLSNVSFINLDIDRVIFKNCKLMGTNFIDCNISNIKIKESNCNYINFSSNKIKKTLIVDSKFLESTWTSNTLSLINLQNIDLSNSMITTTNLKNIDLSSCTLTNIKTDLSSIKGSIIDCYQAMDLIKLLDVQVK